MKKLQNLILLNTFVFSSQNAGYKCTEKKCHFELELEHAFSMTAYYNGRWYPLEARNGTIVQTTNRYWTKDMIEDEPIDLNEVKPVLADGSKQTIITINKQYPGPTLEVPFGAEVTVKVINKLSGSISPTIHWHGFLMRNGAYWYDGVMGITQCGIQQDHEFTYKLGSSTFFFNSAWAWAQHEAGTKWYHAHSSGLRADGLYGGFIVHEEPDHPQSEIGDIKPVIFTEFNTKDIHHSGSIGLVFSNFENNGTGENLENWDDRFTNPDGTHTAPYPHITTLVNGRANTVSDIPLDVIYSDDQEYISFISASNNFVYEISIDNHLLEVIELDSHRIETQWVDFIHIAPGVSARVRPHQIALDQFDEIDPVDHHWIRVDHLASNFLKNGTKIEKPFGGSAIYKTGSKWDYNGSTQSQQKPKTSRRRCSDSYQCRVLDCQWPEYPRDYYRQCINMNEIRALYPGDLNEDADETIIINAEWPSFNGFRFKSPAEPFSTNPKTKITPCPSECDGWTKKESCRCTHMINLEYGKTYNLIFTAMQDKSHMLHHPIHLHGYTMEILYAGYGNYQNGKLNPQYSNTTKYNPIFGCPNSKYCHKPEISDPEELQRLISEGLDMDWDGSSDGRERRRPSRRTTFHLPTQGFVVARLKADNPGIWLAHCHMMMHHEEGMAFLLNVTDKGVPKLPPGFPKCPNFNEPGELESSLVSLDSI